MASLLTLVLTQSCTVDTNVFVIANYVMLFTTCLVGPKLAWTAHNPIIFSLIIFWHVESFSTKLTRCIILCKTTARDCLITFLGFSLGFRRHLPTTTFCISHRFSLNRTWRIFSISFFLFLLSWARILLPALTQYHCAPFLFSFFSWLFLLFSRTTTTSKCSLLVSRYDGSRVFLIVTDLSLCAMSTIDENDSTATELGL